MRILWIFLILGVFIQVQAKSPYNKLPPAEMIMMGIFDDDDDVESVSDFTKPIERRKQEVTNENTTDLFIQSRHGSFTESVESYERYQELESVDLSQYSNISKGSFKIALLVPKKVIGAHANSVSNSILSYLLFKETKFQFEVFDSGDEEESSISQKLEEIRAKGYQFVIAPLTKKGAEVLMYTTPDLLVFIPTVNKQEMTDTRSNIIFGGIDYRAQIDALLIYANDKVVLFNDGSSRSRALSEYIKEQAYESIVYAKDIKNIKTDLSYIIKKNTKLKKASIFLNMPIVKSSLVASQLTQHEVKPHVLLSTQVNYNPLLLKLTQFKDREFFYIANSILYPNQTLKEINLLLGNSPDYSWIDYSTSIGIDYIFSTNLADSRVFEENIYGNQIEYKVRIEKAGASSFVPIGDGRFNY
ncbi:MAG TPA: hypothetical protein EYG75_02180 [Campylobacterales bacterium]|nr:hypothetical protein [Campylobacterales bacterium]